MEAYKALATLMMFLGVSGVAWVLVSIILQPRRVDAKLGRFEIDRRQRVRSASKTYQLFEPWIDELAGPIERSSKKLNEISQNLAASGINVPWNPAEFLATKRVEALGAACIGALFGWFWSDWSSAAMMAVFGFFAYEFMARRLLKSNAVRRQIKVKRRFAAAIDLMALMMEVGSGFQEALNVAADEARGNPLGDELAIVRRDLTMGKREDALRNFAKRTQDDDIAEVVLAIIEGEQLGTPLAKIFRVQAEQMRQKRSQWAEKATAESEVTLVFPAMLIMIACLILVAAPFVLTAIFDPGGKP